MKNIRKLFGLNMRISMQLLFGVVGSQVESAYWIGTIISNLDIPLGCMGFTCLKNNLFAKTSKFTKSYG